MYGKEKSLQTMEYATKEAERLGLEAEILWSSYREATMRSAWGQVHQTPTADSGELTIRLRNGLRAARVSVTEGSRAAIRDAVRQCSKILPEVPENPYLPDLALQPGDLPEEKQGLQEIAQFPDDLSIKERAFTKIRQAAQGTDLVGSARFFTAACEIGVANTRGLARYHTASYSFLSLVVTGERGLSSYADRAAARPGQVDVESAIEEVFSRAALAKRLPFLDPFTDGKGARRYDAVFGHYAVGDWLAWVTMFTFNGLAVFEGRSFLGGKKSGDRITGPSVTIEDNWEHPDVIALPFDLEGRTREKLTLVREGIFGQVPFDGMTAKKAGVNSTGHSLLDPWGAVPLCVVTTGGSKTLEELVRKSEKPTIVATFFNYPSMPDEKEAVFTATTRHGTFLVEDGSYKAVCPPLRLRVKTFDALSRIKDMTPARLIRGQDNYGMFYPISFVVPAMRIEDVDFVGSNPSM